MVSRNSGGSIRFSESCNLFPEFPPHLLPVTAPLHDLIHDQAADDGHQRQRNDEKAVRNVRHESFSLGMVAHLEGCIGEDAAAEEQKRVQGEKLLPVMRCPHTAHMAHDPDDGQADTDERRRYRKDMDGEVKLDKRF